MALTEARAAVLIPAAGSGQRLGGGTPKALRLLGGRTLLEHALRSLSTHPAVIQVVVAVPGDSLAAVASSLPREGAPIRVVAGGASRQASVCTALAEVGDDVPLVLVHDAARPLVPPAVVDRVVAALRAGAAAVVPGLPVVDTIKRVDESGLVVETPPRDRLRAVQTPQGFRHDVLRAAHAAAPDADSATDDASLAEAAGYPVLVVPGDPLALKITAPEDLARAELLLAGREGP